MDSYSYIELALVWENPTELKFVEGLNWQKLSSQAYMRLLSVALILSVLSVASSASAALKPGDNGEQVRRLQQRLKDLGHFPRNQQTSIFYRRITEDAVSKFQRTYAAYGLKATGFADDFTLYYLGLGPYPTRSTPSYPPSPGQPRTIRTCDGWRFGNKGYEIRILQQQLKALGFFYGGVDGKYRERTRDAVTRFQKVNNLTPTGCADYNTLVAINQGITEISYSYPPITYPLPRLNPGQGFSFLILRKGSTGELVTQLQNQLANLRFNPGKIDGIFGNDTEYAVKQFQRSVGLNPNGIVSPDVQSLLKNTIARNQAIPYGTPFY
jgi:peptidoglycan hydrolase-like protein with peptidoglycan-binding domain